MKGMTMTEKLIALHCGKDYVVPGELVMANLDMICPVPSSPSRSPR